jgi:hypothetical protein
MTDRLAALLQESPAIERASKLAPPTLPVLQAFTNLLPHDGLLPGSTTQIRGVASTSLALALAAKASETSWTALVGLPHLGLRAASELGVDLEHVVVVPEATVDVFAAVVDAFDVVLSCPPPQRKAPRIAARVRERDAVLLVLGRHTYSWPDADLTVLSSNPRWYGLGDGHGHLAARTIDVTVTGRRAAARPRQTTLWLPDEEGEVREQRNVVRLHA